MSGLLLFSLSVLVTTVISGMAGLGGGVLLLALMSPMFPPLVLIPLHGTIQFMSNIARTAVSVRQIDWKIVLPFLAGSATGAALGASLTIHIAGACLGLVIGLSILVFTWVPKLRFVADFKGKFLILGCFETFLSLFIGATGPLTSPFFLKSRLTAENFVPTKSACQIPVHFFKIAVYIYSGFAILEWWKYILVSIPLVFVSSVLGKWLVGKIEERLYKTAIKLTITVLAFKMLADYFLGGS